jgi:Tol biopolymer transport system component
VSAAPERLVAALADRYRIERELGVGGMATVFLAHDLKHDRKVALKVLKPELTAVLGAERFVVEIRTTAALQHPHILPLFDSGTADGFLYYVMPFVEGETLRRRLDRETQLGIDEAIRITREVADALDYAHRHGVIHRDIKPENILLADGRPMVADFGIALAVSAAAGGRMTETGLSLGTPHYMSPEQATAEKEITNRSDIYSLGSVLYEMLTGSPPHVGASAQQIIMKIVTEEAAPVTRLRRSVPANVSAAVAKSLEKLPADRFESAKAFAEALNDPHFMGPADSRVTVASEANGRRARRVASGLVAAGVVLLVLAGMSWRRTTVSGEVSRQRVVLWRHALGGQLDPGSGIQSNQAAIAPDGSSIVYTDSIGGKYQLMRKRRSQSAASLIAGTEGALAPFFSPDGGSIGYRTQEGKLVKLSLDGGSSTTLADDGDALYLTAAWLDDGTIIYAGRHSGLRRIEAAGGASRQVGDTTSSALYLTFSPLPGSRGFLYTKCVGNCAIESAIYVFDFSSDSGRLLVSNAAGASYSPTGHLLYTHRGGGLYAARFDLDRMRLTSSAVPIIENVVPVSFTMSRSGSALYSTSVGGGSPSELALVARDGSALPLDSAWRADFQYPALSPDGQTLAVSVREGSTQLWLRRSDGTRQKLTDEGTINWRPSWSADGRSLLFSSNRSGGPQSFDLLQMPADANVPAKVLQHYAYSVWEGEVSHDGQWLVVRSDDETGDGNIRARRLVGDTAFVTIQVDRSETKQIALSPDGRWIAYSGDGTGRPEIYVAPFPAAKPALLVSLNGGAEPRWSSSGRELFYKSGGWLMSVEIAPGSTLRPGLAKRLFSVSPYRSAVNRQQYDVSPDGRHFIMIRDLASTATDLVYVENWLQELTAATKK